jgi:hypothetical protein
MNYPIDMIWVECRICGTPMSIASKIWDNLAANGGMFKCSLGHDIRPRAPTEITKLQEEMAEAQRKLDVSRANVDERDGTIAYLTRANAALRGYIKRLKKGAR